MDNSKPHNGVGVLVADSGSTGTQWAMDGCRLQTIGLNPLFAAGEVVDKTLQEVAGWAGGRVRQVHFYGAGCGTPRVCDELRMRLKKFFLDAEVCVESDMLGACRAAMGGSEGLVAILGTGSNACYYDGCDICCKTMASGFILGDEGSGNYIGRMLVKSFLQHRMPESLAVSFGKDFLPNYSQFMERVYRAEMPNRYLASMVRFAVDNVDDKYITSLLSDCFDAFFEQQVKCLPRQAGHIAFVGGVAYQFRHLVAAAAVRAGYKVDGFVKEPIEALVAFHQSKTQQ